MMVYKELGYLVDFDNFKRKKAKLYLENVKKQQVKTTFGSLFQSMGDNFSLSKKNLNNLSLAVNDPNLNGGVAIGLAIYQKAQRMIAANELIYTIRVFEGETNIYTYQYYIPQKELKEILSNAKYFGLFLNVESFDLNKGYIKFISPIWYQGTKNKKEIKAVEDLDPKYSEGPADSGKGVYLVKNLRTAYEFLSLYGEEGVKKSDRGILKGEWFNNDLDALYYEALIYKENINSKKWYTRTIIDRYGVPLKVLVIVDECKVWRQMLWDGWVLDKSQGEFDIVFSPMSTGYLYVQYLEYREELKKGNADVELDFINSKSMVHIKTGEGEKPVYQVCIYNKHVMKNFQSKNTRK